MPDLRGGRLEVDLPAPAPPSLDPLDRRAWPWLVALALVVRVVLMWVLEPSPPIADENWYRGTALRLLARDPSWLWTPTSAVPFTSPPVVPMVYALAMALFGEAERTLRLVNVAAGALLVLPVHRLGVAFAGARAGRAAAVLVALYPDLLLHGVRLWTEPLYTLILWLALGALVAADTRPRSAWVAGGLLGVAALTREVGLALPLVVVVWGLVETTGVWWRRGSRVVVVLAAMTLVVLPWAVRLRVDPQPAGLVARTSAFNLYVGNVGARPPYKELGATEAERTAVATARVKQVVWADMPAWPWHKVQRTLPRFVGPRTLPVVGLVVPPTDPFHLRARGGLLDDPATRRGLSWVCIVTQVAVLAAGAVGAVLALRRREVRGLALVLLAVFLATYLPAWVTFAKPRFLLPAVPVFAILGAHWLVAPRTAWREVGWGTRLVAVVVGAGAGWLCLLDLP